jgi:putative two-component system response regulator
MVSVGEEGWDSGEIRKKLKIGKMEDGTMADFDADGDNRILVVGDKSGVNLVQLLKEEGFSNAEAFVFEGDKLPDIRNANAVIIQGDLDKIPDLAHQLLPALPDPSTPIIVQYSERSEDSDLTALPESADYIPPGASNDYLIHRLRRSLDMVQAQSDAKEVESFILRLIRLMEEGDSDVLGHSQQVAIWAVRLGGRMGLSPEEIEALKWGGLLHDIGKLFLPGKILSKSRMLTAEEFAITKSHPRLGFDLCNGIGILEPALPIIKYHHERMDGKGYPEGLRGDKIPLLARIIAVPDVFDTLIRRRPYRPAFPVEEASKIVMSEAEKGMWDINIAKQFLEMIQR